MEAEINTILESLNQLLDYELSLPEISYLWDEVAEELRKQHYKITVFETKSYYLDEQLNRVYINKNKGQSFEQVVAFREREKKLIEKNAGTEIGRLRSEPSFFYFQNGYFLVFLNKKLEKERLIYLLIESYELKEQL